jgi:deoxycytidylate deaminase
MIESAIAAALKSEYDSYKVGAAIYNRRGKLLSVGWNKRKTHVKQAMWAFMVGQPLRQFLHAEIDALIKCRRGDPHTIVVVRITSTGLAMAKPCAVCARAIFDRDIKKIYWTNSEGVLTCWNPETGVW